MQSCSIMASCWCMGRSIHCHRDILAYDFVYVCTYVCVCVVHMSIRTRDAGTHHE